MRTLGFWVVMFIVALLATAFIDELLEHWIGVAIYVYAGFCVALGCIQKQYDSSEDKVMLTISAVIFWPFFPILYLFMKN